MFTMLYIGRRWTRGCYCRAGSRFLMNVAAFMLGDQSPSTVTAALRIGFIMVEPLRRSSGWSPSSSTRPRGVGTIGRLGSTSPSRVLLAWIRYLALPWSTYRVTDVSWIMLPVMSGVIIDITFCIFSWCYRQLGHPIIDIIVDILWVTSLV